MAAATTKKYEARMFGIGYSKHTTEAAAKRALAKFRRDYRNMRASMPYPRQSITCEGREIYAA
jgi:hypothetical protein